MNPASSSTVLIFLYLPSPFFSMYLCKRVLTYNAALSLYPSLFLRLVIVVCFVYTLYLFVSFSLYFVLFLQFTVLLECQSLRLFFSAIYKDCVAYISSTFTFAFLGCNAEEQEEWVRLSKSITFKLIFVKNFIFKK